MHSAESVEQVERLLRGEGIVPTVRRRRTHFGLFVWRQDIARATQIFRQVQSESPEVERRGLRRDFDWFFLAMLVGFAPATVCLMQSRISRFSAFACLITAAGVGLMVELVRKNRVRNGTSQFRISDLAWFLSIVAAVIACWQAV